MSDERRAEFAFAARNEAGVPKDARSCSKSVVVRLPAQAAALFSATRSIWAPTAQSFSSIFS